MKKILCLSFVLCLTAWGAKSEDDYWKNIDFKISKLDSILDESNCYDSAEGLFACATALNSMLKFESDVRIFVPESRRVKETEFGAAIETFGPISLVTPKKNKGKTSAEAIKLTRLERKEAQKSWKDLFNDSTQAKIDFTSLIDWFKKRSYFKDKESAIVAAGINGVYHVTRDPHTSIMPRAYWDDMNQVGASDVVGIGVVLQAIEKNSKSYIAVQRPVEEGPAFKAGMKAGDLLVKIDGTDVVGKTLEEVSSKIRGKEGDKVSIDVERGTATHNFTIVRARIIIKNITQKLMGKKSDVGYIKLNSFVEFDASNKPTPCKEVKAALKDLTSKGAKSIVFDLRDNGGGLLGESYCIANAFLDLKSGEPILFTKEIGPGGAVDRFPTVPEPVTTSLPMILLVDSGSASASEIVAGALQDYERAFLIGERSWGKGSVQRVKPFGSSFFPSVLIKQTVARFYMPSGRTNQIVGVSPDMEVFVKPNATDEDKVMMREEDLYSALPATGKTWSQTRVSLMKKLSDCVEKNGKAEADFAASSSSAIPFDYQQAVGIDAANCVVDEKLWTSSDKRPTFPEDLTTITERAIPTILKQLNIQFNR